MNPVARQPTPAWRIAGSSHRAATPETALTAWTAGCGTAARPGVWGVDGDAWQLRTPIPLNLI